MTIKKYSSKRYTRLSVVVKVEGEPKPRTLQFEHGYNMGDYKVYAYYITTKPEMQKALEASKGFNSDFFLVEETTISEPKAKEETDVKVFEDITDIAEAKAILMSEPYKCTKLSLNNAEKFANKCKELKVSFPNLEA